MQIHRFLLILLPILIIIAGCKPVSNAASLNGVGLLLEETIDIHGWNSKGYQGLLNIHSNLNIDVYFKEDINSLEKVERAVAEFAKEDVRLIFGHGRIFANFFTEVGKQYPEIHFVSFNGDVEGENVTSLQFESYAMGYFAGILASKMSKTGKVGVIAAYSWQPEVQGFHDGARISQDDVVVDIKYVQGWSDEEKALLFLKEMKEAGTDVFYPTGDGFHIKVIEHVKEEGLYAVGYIGDQSDLGENTVLTSTIQHVDMLYEIVAEQYIQGQLNQGNISFDFHDGVISLGSFSPNVPDELQKEIEQAVNVYIETGNLPEA